MLVMTACTDDIELPATVDGPEGEDTTINLTIQAPEMSRLESRADMTTSEANSVQSLWVGIYSYATRRSTLSDDGGNNGLLLQNGEHGFTSGDKNHTRYTLTDINTKSGRSYIVAVANPDLNYGYTMDANGKLGPKTLLSELLAQADTWDKFLSIVIERELFQDAANLELPNATVNPLPMSGIYIDNENLIHPADWTKVEPYQIPLAKQSIELKGSIHLRRPFTQVKFNIGVAENTDIVSIEPQSYVVYNVPTYGWLYERSQGDTEKRVNYANAGDAMQPIVDDNTNYKPSLVYPSTNITENNGVYSFDFWMMENKRTGRADFCTNYQKREREYKNVDGTNSGIYESLCPTATPELNNFATYVELHCLLTYNNPGNLTNPDVGDNEDPLPDKVDSRTVEAVYTIHLGYATGGDNTVEKACDFNNYRNSIYNYNVRIKSASEIILEAYLNTENQPGAEGLVADVTKQSYELDSHYNAFNIMLTNTEIDNFSFTVRSFYGNDSYEFATDKDGNTIGANPIPVKDQITDKNTQNYLYFSWIEFVPTTDEKTLAAYPGINKNENKFKINQVRGNNKLKKDPTGGPDSENWITVFVNEYTYEDESGDESNSKNWHEYVMKPNRVAYLNVAQKISNDKNSSYYKAKYGISQKSIQTYYQYKDNEIQTAIGVEYDNEIFGMNLRWPSKDVTTTDGNSYPLVSTAAPNVPGSIWSADNGRYNVWNSLSNTKLWTEYVQCGNYLKNTNGVVNHVNEISNTTQSVPDDQKEPKTWPVPQPVLLRPSNFTADIVISDEGTSGRTNAGEAKANIYDPQIYNDDAQFIHAMHACMNRNRDNNGNGVIDADELRWYLPASGKYVRVIMGRNGLRNPIMNYNENKTISYPASSGNNSRLHLIASDARMIWADEGLSTSEFPLKPYGPAPWAVRCIRNLGVDLSKVTDKAEDDPVKPAYEVKKGSGNYSTGGIVRITRYYGTSLRDYIAKGVLPMHKVPDPQNKLGQYGFEIALRGNKTTEQSAEATVNFTNDAQGAINYQDYVNNATPCKDLNDKLNRKGWRVPNQKELNIINREKMLTFPDEANKFFMSCTQENWTSSGSSTSTNFSDYRICSVRYTYDATARPYTEMEYVRCVRDLTPEEANMTYEQILAR